MEVFFALLIGPGGALFLVWILTRSLKLEAEIGGELGAPCPKARDDGEGAQRDQGITAEERATGGGETHPAPTMGGKARESDALDGVSLQEVIIALEADKSVADLLPGIEAGSAECMYRLACKLDQVKVPCGQRDQFAYLSSMKAREVARWMTRAAEAGNSDAQYKVGMWNVCGYSRHESWGIGQSGDGAIRWLELAASGGSAEAYWELGWLYLGSCVNDMGNPLVEIDAGRAIDCLENSARHGCFKACHLLGEIRLLGGEAQVFLDVPEFDFELEDSLVDALAWHLLGAQLDVNGQLPPGHSRVWEQAGGFREVSNRLESCLESLSGSDLASARALARDLFMEACRWSASKGGRGKAKTWRYSDLERRRLVSDMLEGRRSVKDQAKLHGVSESSLRKWKRDFELADS